MSDKTRGYEVSAEVQADPESVWKAISTAEGLERWFALEARVSEAGPGGAVWVSWGKEMEGNIGTIRAWEPGRRLALTDERGGATLATEILIEPRGGGTSLVRIVASGFGPEDAWEDEIEGTKTGWTLFLAQLRHSLERHPDEPRTAALVMARAGRSRDEVWPTLLERMGQPGDVGSRHQALGDTGEVAQSIPGRSLALTVDSLGDGLIAIELGPRPGGCYLGATIAAFGANADRAAVDALAARCDEVLKAL